MVVEQIARLEKLHSKLIDHRGAYRITPSGYTMSANLYNLSDTYDIMRGTPAWNTFCENNSLDVRHAAIDLIRG